MWCEAAEESVTEFPGSFGGEVCFGHEGEPFDCFSGCFGDSGGFFGDVLRVEGKFEEEDCCCLH